MSPDQSAPVTAPPPGCPAHVPAGDALPPLYGPGFAADPLATYELMRRTGPAHWAELAPGVRAIIVTGYEASLEVLRSPYFSRDARRWSDLVEGRIPPDNPVAPMMAWRPSLLFADGERQLRLRASIDDALNRIDSHHLRTYVERSARRLIRDFSARGEADLVREYANRLPALVFGLLFGAPGELVDRMARACEQMIDAEPEIAQRGGQDLGACLGRLVAEKRHNPGQDVTSWLLEHPTALTDEEAIHQHVVLIGAGTVPQSAWIASATMLLLTDDRFAASLSGGSLSTSDALNDVLWTNSPMNNFCFHYATREYRLRDSAGTLVIPPGVPVLVSHLAANTDPALDNAVGQRAANRSHLGFGGGPHVCPAQDLSGIIAEVAIDTLLDQLPDLELAVPVDTLTWRPGPFHRGLDSLPVRFPPPHETTAHDISTPGASAPAPAHGGTPHRATPYDPAAPGTAGPHTAEIPDKVSGGSSWNSTSPSSSTPQAATFTPKPHASATRDRPRRWFSPAAWKRGR